MADDPDEMHPVDLERLQVDTHRMNYVVSNNRNVGTTEREIMSYFMRAIMALQELESRRNSSKVFGDELLWKLLIAVVSLADHDSISNSQHTTALRSSIREAIEQMSKHPVLSKAIAKIRAHADYKGPAR